MKKICLIVDNPDQDLDGLVLLAHHLNQMGHLVYLTPMYSQRIEVPLINPDIVVCNYARKANSQLLNSYASLGISVGILDTEGGIWEDAKYFVDSLDLDKCGASLRFYCFWGSKLRDAALARFSSGGHSVLSEVTGCPRFDFYAAPWSAAWPNESPKPFVMVTSSFAFAAPRFVDSETEVKNLVNSGFSEAYARMRLEDERMVRPVFVEEVAQLAGRLPGVDFVFRPHPFESDDDYKIRFRDIPNISVVRGGPIGRSLQGAIALVHLNSSVAVDASLMAKPVFTMDWVNTDVIRNLTQITFQLSRKSKSLDDLATEIRQIANGDRPHVEGPSSAIQDWFFDPGRAASRLANLIETIQRHGPSPRAPKKLCEAVRGPNGGLSLKHLFDLLMKFIIGEYLHQTLRARLGTLLGVHGDRSKKAFTADQVQAVLARINRVTPLNRKSVARQARRRWLTLTGGSVRVESSR